MKKYFLFFILFTACKSYKNTYISRRDCYIYNTFDTIYTHDLSKIKMQLADRYYFDSLGRTLAYQSFDNGKVTSYLKFYYKDNHHNPILVVDTIKKDTASEDNMMYDFHQTNLNSVKYIDSLVSKIYDVHRFYNKRGLLTDIEMRTPNSSRLDEKFHYKYFYSKK